MIKGKKITEKREMTPEEEGKAIAAAYDKAEIMREQGYTDVKAMNEAGEAADLQERNRLAAKYGEEYPRVKELDTRLAFAPKLKKAIETEESRVKNSIRDFPSGTWRVYGRVVNSKGEAQPGLTLSLFKDGAWVKQLGQTCSNQYGAFILAVEDTKLIDKFRDVPLYLTVTDAQSKVIWQDSSPVMIEANKSEDREIVLSDSHCADPGQPGKEEPTDPKQLQVYGTLTDPKGAFLKGYLIHAMAAGLPLGKPAETDECGDYHIFYEPEEAPKPGKDNSVILNVFDPSGKQVHRTNPVPLTPPGTYIDIKLPR